MTPALARELAAGADRLSVIVHLAAPADAWTPLEPGSKRGDTRRRAAVEPLIKAELEALVLHLDPSDLTSIRTFRLQPAFAAEISRRALDELLERSSVALVELDRRWIAHTEEGLRAIGADIAHELGFGGQGTAVAIIDTGIDYLHPALGGGSIPNPRIVHGLDTGDSDSDPMDCGSHGTAVASVVAGSSYQWNPQRRFAGGVAPQAKILAYKASPDDDCGAFEMSAVIEAIEDAVLNRNGGDYTLAAINLSLGGGSFAGPCDAVSPSYAAAVEAATQAGIAVVASSGNQGETGSIAAPACFGQVISAGSVWDMDSGWVGYSFCLNPECSTQCDDSFRSAKSVTCYTNSGPTLDVLAPSEYLKAAASGGHTTEFGGTSGAAAYVTGAIALLRQANPDLTPMESRMTLSFRGEPLLDSRNELLRPLIRLGRPELMGDAIGAIGDSQPIGEGYESRAESTITIAEGGAVGSVRVVLHLLHPNPRELRISLSAPDGSSVTLHENDPGSFPNPDGFNSFGGIWGCYPDEIEARESLGRFSGLDRQGAWTLEVVDLVENGAPAEARLIGWSLEIAEQRPPDPEAQTIVNLAVVAHQDGDHDTSWVSDLRLFNPSPTQAVEARLLLVPAGEDGRQSSHQTEVVIPPNSIRDLPDVVARRFGVTGTRGALRIETEGPRLHVTSHTFTANPGLGRYGQFVGAVDPTHSVATGSGAVWLPQLVSNELYRTNVGFTEIVGRELTVRLERRDGSTGSLIGNPTQHTVAAFSNLQIQLPPVQPSDNIYAMVAPVAGDGTVAAYASVVDNRSGDAVFVPAFRPAAADALMIPVVARQQGHGGTLWRSDLRLTNADDDPVEVELELRQELDDGELVALRSLAIGGHHAAAFNDLVYSLFGLDSFVGSLRIQLREPGSSVAATSRTFSQTLQGSFGQYIPAVEHGVGPRAAIIHVVDSAELRTNIGLCEVAGAAVQIRCSLFDQFGRPLAQPRLISLDAFRLLQINDIFAFLDAPASENARLDLVLETGDGNFAAYASVVDATTGDAIYVPAQSTPQ